MQLFGKTTGVKGFKTDKQAKKKGCGSLFRRSKKRAAEPVVEEEQVAPQGAPAELVPRLQLEALSLGDEPAQEAQEEEPAFDSKSDCSSVGAAAEEIQEEEIEAPCMAALRQVAERAAELSAVARAARAHRSNCLALSSFGEGVVAVLEAKGPLLLLSDAATDCLPRVASLLGSASLLAASCSAPGWLLAAASNEGCTVEGMRLVHAQLSAALKEHGLDSAPGLKLPAPEYFDASRSLHRRLRVLGNGSLHGGLTVLAGSEDEQGRLGEALGVEAEEVALDAAHILAAGLVQEDAAPAGLDALAPPGMLAVFAAYACFGAHAAGEPGAAPELDSFRCAKLVREAGLLSRSLTLCELDVMFVRAKERGARRLTFAGFVQLLALVAEKRNVPVEEVFAAVAALEARGPERRATTPEAVRFHDDRSTYTGTHARGGMRICDDRMELSQMVDRDAAEKQLRRASLQRTFSSATTAAAAATPPLTRMATGLTPRSTGGLTPRLAVQAPASSGAATPRLGNEGVPPASARGTARSSLAPRATPPASHALTPSAFAPTPSPAVGFGSEDEYPATASSIMHIFESFSAWGRSGAPAVGMDSKQYAKLMRDSGLLGRGLDGTRVDLIFAGVVGKGACRMGLPEFYASLPRLAEARRCSRADLVKALCACEGPTRNGATTPQSVPLAEKSNFTGIATRGGPSTLDSRITLQGMVSRAQRT